MAPHAFRHASFCALCTAFCACILLLLCRSLRAARARAHRAFPPTTIPSSIPKTVCLPCAAVLAACRCVARALPLSVYYLRFCCCARCLRGSFCARWFYVAACLYLPTRVPSSPYIASSPSSGSGTTSHAARAARTRACTCAIINENENNNNNIKTSYHSFHGFPRT